MNDRIRIQNHLIGLGREFKFKGVSYDKTSGAARLDETEVKAKTSLCNETTSQFGSDKRMGRIEARQRSVWTFQLLLEFDQEVSLEEFEQSLTNPVIRLPRNESSGYSNVAIRLLRTSVDHPVQQQPAGGSRVTMTFEVDPPRI